MGKSTPHSKRAIYDILDILGFDIRARIIVGTVKIGQSEFEISSQCDMILYIGTR